MHQSDKKLKIISSFQNEVFKKYLALAQAKKIDGKKASDIFMVEGEREVQRALTCGLKLETILTTDAAAWPNHPVIELAPHLLMKLQVRESIDQAVGVFKRPQPPLFAKFLQDSSIKLIALENCEKPGNLGAVARTAVAFGMTGIVLLGQSCDPWSANCVRSSVGAIFEIPVFVLEYEEFLPAAKCIISRPSVLI